MHLALAEAGGSSPEIRYAGRRRCARCVASESDVSFN